MYQLSCYMRDAQFQSRVWYAISNSERIKDALFLESVVMWKWRINVNEDGEERERVAGSFREADVFARKWHCSILEKTFRRFQSMEQTIMEQARRRTGRGYLYFIRKVHVQCLPSGFTIVQGMADQRTLHGQYKCTWNPFWIPENQAERTSLVLHARTSRENQAEKRAKEDYVKIDFQLCLESYRQGWLKQVVGSYKSMKYLHICWLKEEGKNKILKARTVWVDVWAGWIFAFQEPERGSRRSFNHREWPVLYMVTGRGVLV